ncbi:MAG: 30S ribosomal protein S6 [Deltaproteobacteria bacterium]|nr:30S ribosomal protein S6 [Deltaproteobacteria bacterium]
MREYEIVYILKGNLEGPAAEKIGEKIKELVGRNKGILLGLRYLGKKMLAYRIEKETRGNYYLLSFLGEGAIITELEKIFRYTEEVIRFLTVKVSDEVDVEKRKKEFEAKKFQEPAFGSEGSVTPPAGPSSRVETAEEGRAR